MSDSVGFGIRHIPSNLVAPYTLARILHSLEKQVSTIIGHQRFSYAAPSTWNEIPLKFTIALPLLASKGFLKHITFHVPSLNSTNTSPPRNDCLHPELALVIDYVPVMIAN